MQQTSRRIPWIDAAKAVGIFIIVLGHTIKAGPVLKYLYSFNVAFFFILLGYTFKRKGSLFRYIKKRFVSTMVPYYCWSIISIFIYIAMARLISLDTQGGTTSLWKNLAGMLYANSRTPYMTWNRPLWFIPCMNATLVFVWLLDALLEKLHLKNSVPPPFLFLVLAVLGIAMPRLTSWRFPFHLENVPMTASFVVLGQHLSANQYIERACAHAKRFAVIFSVSFLVSVAVSFFNSSCDMRTCSYGSFPPLFLVSCITASVAFLMISKRIPQNRVFTYVGSITLPILLMHKFPILFFQTLVPMTKRMLFSTGLDCFICGLVISCLVIAMCAAAAEIIKRICPFAIGKQRR